MRDPAVHAAVLREVTDGLMAAGLFVTGVVASPITGADGNREFLAHGRKPGPGVTRVDADALEALALGDEADPA